MGSLRCQSARAYTVLFLTYNIKESCLQDFPSSRIHIALEHRILDADAKILADFSRFLETFPARAGQGGNIVAHQYQHGYLQRKAG